MDVKLIAVSGPGAGQALDVRGKVFIGADAHCQIRPRVRNLAGIHSLVEVRDGQVYVRDCDTGVGTTLIDRTFHSREYPVFDGDLVAVGDRAFEVRVRPTEVRDFECFDQVPEGWPDVAALREAEPKPEGDVAVHEPFARRTSPAGALAYEAPGAGDVLILVPTATELNDESTVSPLRSDLEALAEMGLPTRVVADLGGVAYMSSRSVGVLLAHYQRLDRAGGAMRVCRAGPNVKPVLHQMRLDRLIDVFDTLEEATTEPWE